MRIGCLSEKYEGGGPGTVSTGEGDSGGVSYGTFQLSSVKGSAASFVSWLLDHDEHAGMGAILSQHTPGSLEFSADWSYCADNWPDKFDRAQEEYVTPCYYDSALDEIWRRGIAVDNLPDALKCVIFSNAVQHGAYYAGELVAESYDPDPARWIKNIYLTKINDPDWSSGAPDLRPGLFARWESEKQDAITLLNGGTI